jgi:hypothetical protein
MNIILIIYLAFVLIWLAGVGVAAFHVYKYRIPGDATTQAFWFFLAIAGATLIAVFYYVSAANWGVL